MLYCGNKHFHKNEAGREVGYDIRSGIQERDPTALYEFAKSRYGQYPVLMQKVYESEERYRQITELRQEKIATDKSSNLKRLLDENSIFQENQSERSENQRIVQRIKELYQLSPKAWMAEASKFRKGDSQSIFKLIEKELKFTKEEQAFLQDAYQKNSKEILNFAEQYNLGNKISLLISSIENAKIVQWSQKQSRSDKEEDKSFNPHINRP